MKFMHTLKQVNVLLVIISLFQLVTCFQIPQTLNYIQAHCSDKVSLLHNLVTACLIASQNPQDLN
jgi:hypothetical protein